MASEMDTVRVVKKGKYFTVISSKKISKGETILKLQGAVADIADKYSLQIGEKKHLYAFSDRPDDNTSRFRFLNHSCSPNSYFDMPYGTLIALKDISPDEEITFHYCTTEYEMTSPFECLCGSAQCLKEIKGYKFLSDEDKRMLDSQIAPHLKITEAQKL